MNGSRWKLWDQGLRLWLIGSNTNGGTKTKETKWMDQAHEAKRNTHWVKNHMRLGLVATIRVFIPWGIP